MQPSHAPLTPQAGRWDMCCCCSCQKGQRAWQDSGLLRPLMRRYYAPALLHRRMRPVVVSECRLWDPGV